MQVRPDRCKQHTEIISIWLHYIHILDHIHSFMPFMHNITCECETSSPIHVSNISSLFSFNKLRILNLVSVFLFIRVETWATQFGDELNWLAKNMTKADEIKKVSDFQCLRGNEQFFFSSEPKHFSNTKRITQKLRTKGS